MRYTLRSHTKALLIGGVLPVVLTLFFCGLAAGQSPTVASAPGAEQPTFATPEEALAALTSAVSAGDPDAVRKLFGPAADEFSAGDPVAGKAAVERFAKRMKKMTNLVHKGDSTVILYVGAENWPFPFPIVKNANRWYFDGEAGIREIDNRRIGENELTTIRVCREVVKVEREYASVDHDDDDVLEYAQQFRSTAGKHDGLYWASTGDDDESPLGDVFANAQAEGYTVKTEPQPYHGYYFKILTRQGPNAPGGAYNYVINGNMIAGFAVLAYPAKYGGSGIMSFIVNQQGVVYQKDLGPNTAAAAAGMRSYDPAAGWTVAEDN
jgi:hypothetical protein